MMWMTFAPFPESLQRDGQAATSLSLVPQGNGAAHTLL
jgi:hypothetical protein